MQTRVILLGPLFTQAERRWNREFKKALERISHHRISVTLPQDEAEKFIDSKGIDFTGIMKDCLKNASSFGVAIAILDGPDADSGTCIEIGYRKGTDENNIVIGIRTDFRSSEDGGLNAMLRICDKIIYFPFNESIEELVLEVLHYLEQIKKVP